MVRPSSRAPHDVEMIPELAVRDSTDEMYHTGVRIELFRYVEYLFFRSFYFSYGFPLCSFLLFIPPLYPILDFQAHFLFPDTMADFIFWGVVAWWTGECSS